MFKVNLQFNENQELNGEGETVKEALRNLNPWRRGEGVSFKTKGTITITDGEKTLTQHIWPFQMKRAFNKFDDTLMLKVLVNRLEAGLKEGLTEKNPTEL